MFITGAYDGSIDEKGRVLVPFPIRRKLDEKRDGHSFYVVPGFKAGILALYPEKYYERLRATEPPDELLSDEAYDYRVFESGHTALVDSDNQGRIVIPERPLKWAALGREITIVAVREHLELWRRDAFEAHSALVSGDFVRRRARARHELRALAPPPPASGFVVVGGADAADSDE